MGSPVGSEYLIDRRFLLFIAGDIEMNPGPPDDITTCPCERAINNTMMIECSKCEQQWHTSCVGLKEITDVPLRKLKTWSCPPCMYLQLPKKIQEKLTQNVTTRDTNKIYADMKNMEERILSKIEQKNSDFVKNVIDKIAKENEGMEKNIVKKIQDQKYELFKPADTPYQAAALKSLVKNQVKNQIRANVNEEKPLFTRIVRKPKDENITNSRELRTQFKIHYPDLHAKFAVVTPAGSYKFQFENEEDAKKLDRQWDKKHFQGNSGLIDGAKPNSTGLVKYVYDDFTEEDIIESITENYPTAKYELFRNKNKEFTGMIKITFTDAEGLNKAIAEKFSIQHQKYIIEPFIFKPRVIKCNNCQKFGHISRICKSKDNPICAKCGKNHKTDDCESPEEEFKCYHCGKNDHITGNYSCEKIKEKLQQLLDRQDGQ